MNNATPVWTNSNEEDVWEAASLLLDDGDERGSDQMTDVDSAESGSPVKSENMDVQMDKPGLMGEKVAFGATRPAKIRRVNRRREEILFLREQAKDLEERLAATRSRLEERAEMSRHLQPMERELLSSAWSSIAIQQLNQRQRSEAEHDRLVAMVEEQRQLARALHRYARRNTIHEIPAPLAVHAQLQAVHQETFSVAQPATFEELERALHSMYEQRNAVFRDPRFDDVLASIRASRFVNEHTQTACVEVVDARVLPFDVQLTANALWESMLHRVSTAVTYNDEDFDVHHDLIKKGFVAALDLPHFQTSVCARVVARRFVERDRVVILRATHFEPIRLATSSPIDPFSVRHYQWNVIEAPHLERLRKNRFATAQIQSFDLSFPTLAPNLDAETEQKILQFCETAVVYHLDISRQAVENILLTRPELASLQPRLSQPSSTPIKLEAC